MTRSRTRTRTLFTLGGAFAAVAVAVAVGVAVATTLGNGGDETANGNVPVEDRASLDGSWRAVNSVGSPQEVVSVVRLRFDGGRLVVETGCNTGNGSVEVVDSRLVAGPLVSTKTGCEPALTEQEAWLFAMVAARPRLERSGPYLYLLWDDARAAESDAPPSGERWWLGLEQESATPEP